MRSVIRVQRELAEFSQCDVIKECPIEIEPIDDNLLHLRGKIQGPPNTVYEGGQFYLDIHIPKQYPFVPPKVKFINRIWHPNISPISGFTCVDILKDKWTAALTLRTVLLSIQSLFDSAEPFDPQDVIVAKQYIDYPAMFELTAKHWTNVYACGPHKFIECDEKIKYLQSKGACEDSARLALSQENWDLQMAEKSLFGSSSTFIL